MIRTLQEEKLLPALDGLRGLAILLVLSFHTLRVPLADVSTPLSRLASRAASFGWTGVDLFFVLSGFLITRILIDAKPAANYFRVFYARRVLRIFPIYYLSLVLIFWIWPWLTHHTRVAFFQLHQAGSFSSREQIWYWLNLVNLRTAYYPLIAPMVTHYWTLSIEEQFYAVWPAIVYRLDERKLVLVSVAGIVGALTLRNLPIVIRTNEAYPNFMYRLTPFRIDTLLFGSLLAVLLRYVPARRTLWFSVPLFFATLAAVLRWNYSDPVDGRFAYTGLAVMYSALLLICLGSDWVGALFRFKPLRLAGKYSYSVYLFHPLVITFTSIPIAHFLHGRLLIPGHGYASRAAMAAIAVFACFLFAHGTWIVIEQPMLKLKRHFRYERVTDFGLAAAHDGIPANG